MNSQMNSNDITEQFIINYLVDLSHTKRVQLLKKVTEKLCQFTDVDAAPAAAPVAAPAAPPNTPELKNEPEQKIEPQEQEQKIEPQEQEQKIEPQEPEPVRLGQMVAEYTNLGICPESNTYNYRLGRQHRYLVLLKSLARFAKEKKYAIVNVEVDEYRIYFINTTTNQHFEIELSEEVFLPNNEQWVKVFRKDWKNTIKSVMNESNDACPRRFSGTQRFRDRLTDMKIRFAEFQSGEKCDILDVLPRNISSYNHNSYEQKLQSIMVEINQTIELLNEFRIGERQYDICPCCLEQTNCHTKCNHPICLNCYSNLRLSGGRLPCPLCRECLVNDVPTALIYPTFE
jgi:hypothetical protein